MTKEEMEYEEHICNVIADMWREEGLKFARKNLKKSRAVTLNALRKASREEFERIKSLLGYEEDEQ